MSASCSPSTILFFRLPLLRWVALATRYILSRRGLICCACIAAGFLSTRAPWIRPPLSTDLRGWEIPFSVEGYENASALLDRDRSVRLATPGFVLLAVLVPSALVTLHNPIHAGKLGGLLLIFTIATHSVLAARNPVLFELLEREQEQRDDITACLARLTAGQSLTSDGNRRVSSDAVSLHDRGRLVSTARFALYGFWLVPLSFALVLWGSTGGLARRLLKLGGWSFAAIAITTPLVWHRMQAEWHCANSWQLMQRADYGNAREELSAAIWWCPALAETQGTWYLAGKLDYHDQRDSIQQLYYRALQLSQQGELPEANVLLTPSLRHPDAPAAVRTLAGEIRSRLGVARFLDENGQSQFEQRRLARASSVCAVWQSSLQADPRRLDCQLYLALSDAWDNQDRDLDSVEQTLAPLLAKIADRSVRADLLNCLGDVFFRAGNYAAARRAYNESRKQFDLPKDMNFRARRGLLGT